MRAREEVAGRSVYFLITVPIGGPMGESPNALVTLHILRMFLVFATTFSLGACKAHFV